MNPSMESAINVARYLLQLAASDDESQLLTNMHVQKLLYLAQGWHLAVQGEALFDERIEAWEHGPVIPDVYHVYKQCRWSNVIDSAPVKPIEDESAALVRQVWRRYQGVSAWGLMRITHRDPSWKDAWDRRERPHHGTQEIEQEPIAAFFRKYLWKTHGPLTRAAVEESDRELAAGNYTTLEKLRAELSP